MYIPTHKKGDIALGKVISDLLSKGWYVFAPISTHACHYDLVASKYDEDKGKDTVLRVQVKCNYAGHRKYDHLEDAFDLYACYFEAYDRIIYYGFAAAKRANSKSIKIRHELPNSATPFYWWEDFTEIKTTKNLPKKRTAAELGHVIKFPTVKGTLKESKVPVSDKKLQKLLWKKSMVMLAADFDMSDRALGKRVNKLDLIKPPAGYWQKSEAGKKKIRKRYADVVKAKLAEL